MDGLILAALLVSRFYHPVRPLANLAVTRWTHVEVCAPVSYVRRQRDGDAHITLDDGTARIVAEIVPAIPLAVPHKGQLVRVRGVSRFDRYHGWWEVHPVEAIERVTSCNR